MKRYDIRNGDTTTAGGRVQASGRDDPIDGVPVAYENDPVWCEKCRTTGYIACVGPRVSSTGSDGRQQALSDDLCRCRCTPAPRLIASQTRSYCELTTGAGSA
ncbi:PAAR domain-containing protein [Trinickia violacea]|uniref:PAAR domain-containing protein n=1 Tax=Trinickia violacea TaxID=2571746 RepID=A0A4P8IXR2_9BURK|nr:PAAR domain-containing protein [Trinickia violacea]QCP53177.1 PAAR domain-containing protein [Trinickia violacea]